MARLKKSEVQVVEKDGERTKIRAKRSFDASKARKIVKSKKKRVVSRAKAGAAR